MCDQQSIGFIPRKPRSQKLPCPLAVPETSEWKTPTKKPDLEYHQETSTGSEAAEGSIEEEEIKFITQTQSSTFNYLKRSVHGLSECPSSYHTADFSCKIDVSDKTPVVEDNALRHWRVWMKRRQDQHTAAEINSNRKPCELVMNAAEDFRKLQEDKRMLDLLKDPKPDLPELEFVDLPRITKAEKHVECEEKMLTRWVNNSYRVKKVTENMLRLREIKPNTILAEELAVVGQKIKPLKDVYTETELPEIVVTEPEEDTNVLEEYSSAVLVIDGIQLRYNKIKVDASAVTFSGAPVEGDKSWYIYFEPKVVNKTSVCALTIENKGTVAIRYSWRLRRTQTFSNKQLNTEPWFTFDKTPGSFLPGQVYKVNFYHHAEQPGLHQEEWALVTQPSFTAEGELRVKLSAIAELEYTLKEVYKVDEYLEQRVAEAQVTKALVETMERVEEPSLGPGIEYRSLLLEDQLFEYHNPQHYFRDEVVQQLKDIYAMVPVDPTQVWDLSLSTLSKVITEHVVDGVERDRKLCKISDLAASLLRPLWKVYELDTRATMVYNVLCKMVDRIEYRSNHLKSCLYKRTVTTDYYGEDGEYVYPQEESKLSLLDLAHYQQSFYVQVYHELCETTEQIAAICASQALLQHKGELKVQIPSTEQPQTLY